MKDWYESQSSLADVHALAGYYARMALGKEPDQELADAFRDLRELKVDVAFPFLLELYHDYEAGALTKSEFVEVARLVESYVFRRAVCAIPTNSLISRPMSPPRCWSCSNSRASIAPSTASVETRGSTSRMSS